MKQKYSDISGIILAGGKSTRMGVNKAFLSINGKTSLQITLEKLDKIFEHVFISSNDIALLKFPQVKIIPDIISEHGPLSGVHAGLAASTAERNLFIPCDYPLMSIEIIYYLVELNSTGKIVLPLIKNIPTYDFGIYPRSFLIEIENQLKSAEEKNPSLRKLVNPENTIFIEVEKLPFFREEYFLNMNNTDDYEKVKEIYKSNS